MRRTLTLQNIEGLELLFLSYFNSFLHENIANKSY